VQLPENLTARPLISADARAVFEVMAAQERHDLGTVEIEEADIVGDWQRPSFVVAASTIGVFDGDHLVAYAEVGGNGRGDAAVHPEYRGRGIGTALAAWTQGLARQRGDSVFGMSVPQGSPADLLLRSLGYVVRWNSWLLELPQGKQIEAQPLPEGHAIRTAEGEADHRAAWTVIEDAFLEWSERDRRSFEDFCATTLRRPGFEPWNLRIVVDPAGETVGACFVVTNEEFAYVDQLAVRKDRRGLGLARALLADAFAIAREHGATRCELSTDSRTGALGLYERVGMVVTSNWVHRAVDLRTPG
jgi:GNAT superfamily N-acetyltransferase